VTCFRCIRAPDVTRTQRGKRRSSTSEESNYTPWKYVEIYTAEYFALKGGRNILAKKYCAAITYIYIPDDKLERSKHVVEITFI
jgi:hypothetical protein